MTNALARRRLWIRCRSRSRGRARRPRSADATVDIVPVYQALGKPNGLNHPWPFSACHLPPDAIADCPTAAGGHRRLLAWRGAPRHRGPPLHADPGWPLLLARELVGHVRVTLGHLVQDRLNALGQRVHRVRDLAAVVAPVVGEVVHRPGDLAGSVGARIALLLALDAVELILQAL